MKLEAMLRSVICACLASPAVALNVGQGTFLQKSFMSTHDWELDQDARARLSFLAVAGSICLAASLWYLWTSTPSDPDPAAAVLSRAGEEEKTAVEPEPAANPGALGSGALFVFALQAFLSCSLVPGWPALIGLLQDEGVYQQQCPGLAGMCPQRSLAFSSVFTVGSVMSYVGSLPAGYFVDFLGSKRGIQVGVSLVIVGSALLGLAPPNSNFAWPLAFGLYGLGGCFVNLANFSSQKDSNRRSLVIGILTTLRVTSGMTLELFSLASRAGFSRRACLMSHVLILGACLCFSSVYWPAQASNRRRSESEATRDNVWQHLIGRKFLCNLAFHMTMIFTYRCMIGFRFDELAWQKQTYSPSMDVQTQLDMFTVSQYSVNIIMIPIFAYMVDKFGYRQAPFVFCAFFHLLWQSMRLVPGQWVLPIFDVVTAMNRQAFASTHYMFMSSEFPTEVYARLIGFDHLMAAFVNLLPTPLLALVLFHFQGNFMVLLFNQVGFAILLLAVTLFAWPNFAQWDQEEKGKDLALADEGKAQEC